MRRKSGRNWKTRHGAWNPQRHGNQPQDTPASASQLFRRYRKFIAPIGIILLIMLQYLPEYAFPAWILENGFLASVLASFAFTSLNGMLFLAVLLITAWFAYKSWLLRIRFLRARNPLLKKLVIVFMALILISSIKADSAPGWIAGWLLFFASAYFCLALFWLALKWIDNLDLSSDLTIWLLRIGGAILAMFGLFSLLFGTVVSVISFSFTNSMLSLIPPLIGALILLLGLFGIFRANRRHAMVRVW
ncbi:MAG: hypothetical protein V1676_06985 [Candidatus Diapherotrites archaeon]